MPDIFISYSSKDREQAQLLTELLSSAGLSVWIDQAGIGAATSWSGEISKAITDCKTLIVLLSPSSIDSKNVTREVALAFERNKKILPIDLEPVTLPDDFAYHLAGIQRTSMTNIDAIIRALGKLGLEATKAPELKLVKETSDRKSLMILPFEDLSPTQDNGWFADGLAAELIGALSTLKALRVADQQATKDYKRYQGTLPNYAKEMAIRYFVQGSVRKFGDQIKISMALLDIETGDHLWQDSMKGTMNDIFDIQETVAEKVVEGLKVHLASDEKRKLTERGTESAEAYELYLRGVEYYDRQTKEGFQLAIQLFSEAIALDPKFAEAYQRNANVLAQSYRKYDRSPHLLAEADRLCKAALRLRPELFRAMGVLSTIYQLQEKNAEAEKLALEYVSKAPEHWHSHFTLGFLYTNNGDHSRAIAPYEESLRLKPDDLAILYNLGIACHRAEDTERLVKWARIALPVYEKHLKLRPDDETALVGYGILLHWSGARERAIVAACSLKKSARDGNSLYNTACLFAMLNEKREALETFHKAIEAGFRNLNHLKGFLAYDEAGIVSLQGTPEYEELERMVKAIEEEAKQNA